METNLSTEHYLGEEGKQYSARQSKPESIGHKLQVKLFQSFVKPDDIILDFGCGKGGIARRLKCRHIDGFDVNRNVLTSAARFCNQTYSAYDEVPVGRYNVVISNHCLEHVPSPLEVLQFIYRWLKPGGRVIFVVPHDCLSSHQNHYTTNDPDQHLYTWTPLSFGNLFAQAGFLVEQVKLIRQAWHPKLFPIHLLPVIGPLSIKLVCWALKCPQIRLIARRSQ